MIMTTATRRAGLLVQNFVVRALFRARARPRSMSKAGAPPERVNRLRVELLPVSAALLLLHEKDRLPRAARRKREK